MKMHCLLLSLLLIAATLSSILTSQIQIKDLPDPWKFVQKEKVLTPWDAPIVTAEELDAVRKICLTVLPIEAEGKYAYLKDCQIGRIIPVYDWVGDSSPGFYFAEAVHKGKAVSSLYVTRIVQFNFSKPPITFWQDEAIKRAQSVIDKHWQKGEVYLGAVWMTRRSLNFHIHLSPDFKEVKEFTWTIPVLKGEEKVEGFVCVDPWTGEARLWRLAVPVGKEGMNEEQAKANGWGYIQIFGLHKIYYDLQPPKEAIFWKDQQLWSMNFNSKVITSPIKDDPNFPFVLRGSYILIQLSKYGELNLLYISDPSIEWFTFKQSLKQ